MVINSPGGNTIAATEHTMGMMMAMARNIAVANEEKMAAQANYEATKGANGVSISLGSSLSARDSADTTFERGNSNSISATLPLYTGNKNELNIDSKSWNY